MVTAKEKYPTEVQYVVWRGTVLEDSEVEEFTRWLKEKIDADIIEGSVRSVTTIHGREDLMFAVTPECIPSFAIKRLAFGMSWLEDMLNNEGSHIYPVEININQYKTW